MCELRDLDLAVRGIGSAVEEWKANHNQVRTAWTVEDLIAEMCDIGRMALSVVDYFRQHGALPNPDVRFNYVIDLIKQGLRAAREAESLGAAIEQKYKVDRLDEMRGLCATLSEIVAEDEFATDMSFESGALNDWA